jgi:type III secretion protein L
VPLAYLLNGTRFKLALEAGTVVKREAFKALEDARTLLLECQAACDAERKRGYEEGLREAHAQCADLLARTHADAARYMRALDGKVVDLVIQAVRRIAPRIGASALVPDIVEQALKDVEAERSLIVRVHPDCRDSVSRRLLETGKGNALVDFVDVRADPTVDPYSCTLESEVATLRADLELQIQAIERAMRESLASPES